MLGKLFKHSNNAEINGLAKRERTAKLFVFIDRSFANNANLTFNDYIEQSPENAREFTVNRNIVHFSSTKCKRVTRSVLTSEIYAIVASADIRLAILPIPTVIYTNLYSLYKCLLYKRREIHKIQWIHGSDNPADSFIKLSLNSALGALVSDGTVKIWMNGWRKLPVLRYQSPGDIGHNADISAAEERIFHREIPLNSRVYHRCSTKQ
ncbi:hypothetical protein LX36DRAFT_679224 [Colletotrichum falcatum]|nr:hypothetical protein LX36DRAFT_679224 [Colletotrichum falcatum]